MPENVQIARSRTEPTESIHIKVPQSLFREVKLLLLDPMNGRVKYGEMSKLATTLLRGWVEQKRKEATDEGVTHDDNAAAT